MVLLYAETFLGSVDFSAVVFSLVSSIWSSFLGSDTLILIKRRNEPDYSYLESMQGSLNIL